LNYVFKHVARKSRGGGVALIYKKAFAFKQISRMQFKSFEYMDMVSNVSNPVRIIVVYRPPPSTSNGLTCESFLSEFRSFLELIILDTGHFIITGDFNFHVDDQNNSQAATFLDIIHSFNLKQHVCEPTHKDGHTLDLIITPYEDNIIDSLYINDPGISDHFSVNVNVSVGKPKRQRKEICCRKLRSINYEKCCTDLERSSLMSESTGSLPVSELVEEYETVLSSLLDTHATLHYKLVTIRDFSPSVHTGNSCTKNY
jgi:hypothetical protein